MSEEHPCEKRRLERLPFAVEVRLHTGDRSLAATTRDICMSGLFVCGLASLPVGTSCQVEIALRSGEQVLYIRARGEVVRQVEGLETQPRGVGVRFIEMDDRSQEILWRVIRYNSPLPAGEIQP